MRAHGEGSVVDAIIAERDALRARLADPRLVAWRELPPANRKAMLEWVRAGYDEDETAIAVLAWAQEGGERPCQNIDDSLTTCDRPALPGADHCKRHHGEASPVMSLTLVVCGEPQLLTVEPSETAGQLRWHALVKGFFTGRPAGEYEIRTEDGVWVDPDSTVEAAGLADGGVLYVTLKVAAGGAQEGGE